MKTWRTLKFGVFLENSEETWKTQEENLKMLLLKENSGKFFYTMRSGAAYFWNFPSDVKCVSRSYFSFSMTILLTL